MKSVVRSPSQSRTSYSPRLQYQPIPSYNQNIGQKRRLSYDESFIPFKRTQSADIYPTTPTGIPKSYSPMSDTTHDRTPSLYETYYKECTPDCRCTQRPSFPTKSFAKEIFSEVVQERYLHHLEQYQKVVGISRAIDGSLESLIRIEYMKKAHF